MAVTATSWSLWSTVATLVVTDRTCLEPAERLVRDYLGRVELAASRFRPDSEVTRLAATGGAEVGDVLADLLHEALRAAHRSGGLVDPTVGTAMRRIGYDRDLALVLRDGAPITAVVRPRPAPGWQQVRLDGNRVTLPRGVELDLGATAKAVAADRSATLVHDRLGTGVLVSLGGDAATAGPTPAGGWQVLVQDRPEDPAARVTLGPGDAVATSSTVTRTWSRGGRRLHHIVDPRTGTSVQAPWRSVTVAARSCVEANTASTASLVHGDPVAWLTALGLPARLLGRDGEVRALNAWPTEEAA